MLHFEVEKNESVGFFFLKSQFLFFSDIPEFQQIKNMWPYLWNSVILLQNWICLQIVCNTEENVLFEMFINELSR
jgi:hypothetical protein